jgi:DNA polymerase V
MTADRKIIPLVPAETAEASACENAEPFALMVLGDSMLPEFSEGEVIVVEPEGLARDGSYVIAFHDGEHTLRQLVRRSGRWLLHPLNPLYADAGIDNLTAVKGVVIQKQRPGSRRSRKSYVEQ